MRRPHPAFALAAVLTVAAACSEEAPTQPVTAAAPPTATAASSVAYACESGGTVEVSYPDATTARLTWEGRAYDLKAQAVETGRRYQGSGLDWWTTPGQGQETAILSRPGAAGAVGGAVLERCSRPAASAQVSASNGPAQASSEPCRGADLRLTAEGGDAGAGSRQTLFALENSSDRACSLQGQPAVVLLDPQGRPLTSVRSEPTAGRPAATVELKPGARAWFDIGWSAIPHEGRGEQTCPQASGVRVTAPGDALPLLVGRALQPCGGRIRVSPVRPAREYEALASQAAA